MSLNAIVAGDYGQVIKLTFIDTDTDLAADISGYTTSQSMIFEDPDGTQTTKTAAFDSDGTDGIIKYTVDADFLTAGQWRVKGQVASGAAKLTTLWGLFLVGD